MPKLPSLLERHCNALLLSTPSSGSVASPEKLILSLGKYIPLPAIVAIKATGCKFTTSTVMVVGELPLSSSPPQAETKQESVSIHIAFIKAVLIATMINILL